MSDSILGMSNDEIIAAAQDMGITDSSTKVVGVYYEVSVDVVSTGFFGAGGEYVRFVGVDLNTGQRVVANYGGLSVGGGLSLIPNTNVGGGAFGFTGDPSALGGWSAGGQLSAGVTAGVSINLDGSGILYFAGADTSIGFNGAGGYTYRVSVDGYTVFDRGSTGNTYFQNGPSLEDVLNLYESSNVIDPLTQNGENSINVVVDVPDGSRVVYEYDINYVGGSVRDGVPPDQRVVTVRRLEYDSSGTLLSDQTDTYLADNSGGEFILRDSCFGPEVPIDMWPLDPELAPGPDGIYDQDAVRAKVWQKPIGQIEIGDLVVSFDKLGNLVPGPVTRTFQNDAKILLDFHGTRVTPGHVYYRPDSKKPHKFETLIDILRDDGVIEHQDGVLIRAATNVPIGDARDGFVVAITGAYRSDGSIAIQDRGRIRLGSRVLVGTGKQRRSWSVADLIQAGGGVVGEDELIRVGDKDPMPFHWEFSDTLPKPEDFVLSCSGTTLEDIYKAAEWESQGPRSPAPLVLDGGPVKPLSALEMNAMPRNEPLDVAHDTEALKNTAPTFNRKQRRKMSAQYRRTGQAKASIQ